MKKTNGARRGAVNLPILIGAVVGVLILVLLITLIVKALSKPDTAQNGIAEGPIPSTSVTPTPAVVTPVPAKDVKGASTDTKRKAPTQTVQQPVTTTTTTRSETTEEVTVKLNPRCTKMRARWNLDDPYQVSFTTEGEADGATIANYQWDFDGNGSWDSEEGRVENSIGHRYSEKKVYTVKSRVRDSLGRWSQTCEIGIDLNEK